MNFVFDLETSGLPSKRDGKTAPYTDLDAYSTARIVSVSWLLTQGDRIMEQSYFVVKGDFEINPVAQEIHGISREYMQEHGDSLENIFSELKESLTHVHSMIAYNIEFDINVLKSELCRWGRGTEIIAVIDEKHHVCCMKKAREYLNQEKTPKLSDVYAHLFGDPPKKLHNAMSDSISCFKVYNAMFPLSRDVFFVKNTRVELTPEQSEIVFAPMDMHLAVLASAGSGKSTTIAARAKHLISQGVNERSIMITTFTRDAANDMKQKMTDIMGYKPDITIGTIDTISKIATYYSVSEGRRELKDVAEHAHDYLSHIRENPESIKRYKYLFVDEFQDINKLQFEIIKEFHNAGAYIFAVGDDHQNIYTFRGSSIEYILDFKTHFPHNSDMFKLTFNFRSTREIISFANASIENNAHQIPKKMVAGIPRSNPSPKPFVKYFPSAPSHNSFVISRIMALLAQGTPRDEIAVLSPLNSSLFLIEEQLTRQGVKNVYLDGKADVRTIKKQGHVCLCTIHKAKGLEWKHVFLTNMSDDLIPKLKTPKYIEESRRLFYVGVTRAKEALYITYTAPKHAPFVTRFVSEVPEDLYDFIDFDPSCKGTSSSEMVSTSLCVSHLVENIDGEGMASLRKAGILPALLIRELKKIQLYPPQDYPKDIEQESLYQDFGNFVDLYVSRALCPDHTPKQALQALSAVILSSDEYRVYNAYKKQFKQCLSGLERFTIQHIAHAFSAKAEHSEAIASIVTQIKQSASKYNVPVQDVPVFNDRFLPPDFQDNMEAALHSYRHEINADKIWELSKCTAIVTSMRRRLLYMGMHPSSFMKGSQMLDNIVNKFVPYVSGEPKVHEEVSSDTGISGELDIRVGTTIIDIKTSISDDITPVHLLQLLAYKALWDANNEKKIEVVGVFNPLRGWYVPIDVSGWSCHSELLNYLYERRQT
jgi:DNA polymerase III epsilon subunit-like protein